MIGGIQEYPGSSQNCPPPENVSVHPDVLSVRAVNKLLVLSKKAIPINRVAIDTLIVFCISSSFLNKGLIELCIEKWASLQIELKTNAHPIFSPETPQGTLPASA